MNDDDNGGSDRNRPYVVLAQQAVGDVVLQVLKAAEVELDAAGWERVRQVTAGREAYFEKARIPSRNAVHALTQAGRTYTDAGDTPPLVAVSERMFRPRTVKVDFDPRVSLI